MDRRIKEYLSEDEIIKTPYTNHIGSGNIIGSGDSSGKGTCFTYKPRKEDYKGSDILSYNGNKVYFIDGYSLYFTHIHKPWASAKIIKNDLTTQDCYVGKINKHVVVSNDLHAALNNLREKINKTNNNEYDIAVSFVYAHPEYEKEYDWDEMVFWHSLSEFSCNNGRRKFSENANKKTGSKATPKELIKIMKRSRAANIANIMEQIYLSKTKK